MGATIHHTVIIPILQVKKQKQREPRDLVEYHRACKRGGWYADSGGLLESLGLQPPFLSKRKQNKTCPNGPWILVEEVETNKQIMDIQHSVRESYKGKSGRCKEHTKGAFSSVEVVRVGFLEEAALEQKLE